MKHFRAFFTFLRPQMNTIAYRGAFEGGCEGNKHTLSEKAQRALAGSNAHA
jgi:hypothetical protein